MKLPVTKIPDEMFDKMYADAVTKQNAEVEKYNKGLAEPWTAVGMTAKEWDAAETRAKARTQLNITVQRVSANAPYRAYDSNESPARFREGRSSTRWSCIEENKKVSRAERRQLQPWL
jgi:hypothetical protein